MVLLGHRVGLDGAAQFHGRGLRRKVRIRQLDQAGRAWANAGFSRSSNHKLPISPNLLNRDFVVAEPDKVWVSDTTHIANDEG